MERTAWWQTALAIIAAVLVFIPALLLSGVVVWLFDLMQEGLIGKTGDGIGFFMRGIQFAGTMALSVYLPHRLLKRSNPTVVASAVVTITLIAFVALAAMAIQSGEGPRDIYGWLDFIATLVGTAVGGTYGAIAAKEITVSGVQPDLSGGLP